jgi:hypothetical protein
MGMQKYTKSIRVDGYAHDEARDAGVCISRIASYALHDAAVRLKKGIAPTSEGAGIVLEWDENIIAEILAKFSRRTGTHLTDFLESKVWHEVYKHFPCIADDDRFHNHKTCRECSVFTTCPDAIREKP